MLVVVVWMKRPVRRLDLLQVAVFADQEELVFLKVQLVWEALVAQGQEILGGMEREEGVQE